MAILRVKAIAVEPQVARFLQVIRISWEMYNESGVLETPSTSDLITIWASDSSTAVIDAAAGTADSAGLAHYDFLVLSTYTPGDYEFRIDVDDGGVGHRNSAYGSLQVSF